MNKDKILLLILASTLSGCNDGFINNKIGYGLKLQKSISIKCAIKSLNQISNISDVKLKNKNITFSIYGYSSELAFNSSNGEFSAYEINIDGMFKFESSSTFFQNSEKASQKIQKSIKFNCLK